MKIHLQIALKISYFDYLGGEPEKTTAEKLEGDEPIRKEKDRLTEHEKKMISDLTLVNKNTKPEYGVVRNRVISGQCTYCYI